MKRREALDILSDVEREYYDLANKRSGIFGHAHYLIPDTDIVFEVHSHIHNRPVATRRRSRESQAVYRYPSPNEVFDYTGNGLIVGTSIARGITFSASGRALRKALPFHLQTAEGTEICRPRNGMEWMISPELLVPDIKTM